MRRVLWSAWPVVHARFISHVLFSILFITGFIIRVVASGSSGLTLDLEFQPPRIVREPSTRGFPARVQLFDPVHNSLPSRWSVRRFWKSSDRDFRFTSRSVTVELLGGITKVGEYYTRILVGGQKIRVQIDTGSSTLAFPVAECTTCPPSDLRYNPRLSKTGKQRWVSCLNPLCARDVCTVNHCKRCSANDACCAEENPAACMFALRYGDGSGARGGLMVDEMTWGNATAPVIFGAILSDSENFERSLVDGILGMAYKSLACNPTCVEPPFQQLVKAGHVRDEFTICITPQGGKLVLGSFDDRLAKSSLTYVPLALSNPPTFYTVNVSKTLTVGKRKLDLPEIRAGIVDSGTTLVVVSATTFILLFEHIIKFYCEVPKLCNTAKPWFRPAACVALPDDDINKLPTLVFHLGSNHEFDLELRPQDYMLRFKKNNNDYRCVGIMAMKEMQPGTDIIFGNTVMQRYVTHYDRQNKRLGFAEATPGCGGTTRCTSYSQCEECASIPGCTFDFRDGVCRDDRGGLGLIPYPECSGSSCFCRLGPRAGLVFGVTSGAIGTVLVSVIVAFVVFIYKKRSYAGSDVGQSTDHAPLYSLNDDEDDADDPNDVMPFSRHNNTSDVWHRGE